MGIENQEDGDESLHTGRRWNEGESVISALITSLSWIDNRGFGRPAGNRSSFPFQHPSDYNVENRS